MFKRTLPQLHDNLRKEEVTDRDNTKHNDQRGWFNLVLKFYLILLWRIL
jgi:hypothetical protein